MQNGDRQKQGQQEGHPIGGPIAKTRQLIGESQTGPVDLPIPRIWGLREAIQAPLLRSKHFFVIAEPRIDVTGEYLHCI